MSDTTTIVAFPNQALPADRVSPPDKRCILVIDDEADIRESLEFLLTSENYLVDLAENATQGLERFESGTHDLILLDLMMPDRSGMEVLAELCDVSTNPEQNALNNEELRRVQNALQHLTQQQRAAVLLRAEELRYREIAAVMGVSTKRVCELVHRALSLLAGDL